jgi:hypothetical protein
MKKTIKNCLIFAAALGLLALGANAYSQHKADRMNAYAEANNCTWQYSWYVNEEPVCK